MGVGGCGWVLFVCGVSLTSGQLINELFPDCLRVLAFCTSFTPQPWAGTASMR